MPASHTLTVGSGSRQLAVEFVAAGDRYEHRVFVGEGAKEPVLTSDHGDTNDGPFGPMLQELHVESREGDEIVMLVGQADKCHWSLSVSQMLGRTGLLFDVACRVKQLPDFLGTTYLVDAGTWRQSDGRAKCEIDGRRLVVRPGVHCGQGTTTVTLADSRLQSVASQPPAVPATVTWSYEVFLAD